MMIDNITVLKEDKLKINKLVINKIKNEKKMYKGYSFYIVFGLLMCLAIWLKLKK